MSKFGFYSDKSAAISFESHLSGLEEHAKTLLLDLRSFVIEEIRPHRIVYAKSLTFRTFLDIQPRNDCLIISIRKGRTEPPSSHTAKSTQELEGLKHVIAETYKTIK
jgi:hypothetical protein